MKRFFFSFFLLITFSSAFAQIGGSYLSGGKYIIGGRSIINAEYQSFNERLDIHQLEYFRVARSSSRENEFDIHINFDELETGCYWNGSLYAENVYQDLGIVFSNNGAAIDDCGNFDVSGHSSPKFLGFNEGYGYAASKTNTFLDPVNLVQINVAAAKVNYS